MNNLDKLVLKAIEKDCRLSFRFDPDEEDEQWELKFYPDKGDCAHFYAFNNDLQEAARQLLDEIRGFDKW